VEDLEEAIEDMGFDIVTTGQSAAAAAATTATVTLRVEGMTCGSCVRTIEEQVSELEAVSAITVSLADRTAHIAYNPATASPGDLVDAIEDCGFDAFAPHESEAAAPVQSTAAGSFPPLPTSSAPVSRGAPARFAPLSSRRSDEELLLPGSPPSKSAGGPAFMSTPSSCPAEPKGGGGHRSTKGQKSIVERTGHGTKKVHCRIAGMSCASCVGLIERRVRKHAGVRDILVALLSEKAEVEYYPDLLGKEEVVELIRVRTPYRVALHCCSRDFLHLLAGRGQSIVRCVCIRRCVNIFFSRQLTPRCGRAHDAGDRIRRRVEYGRQCSVVEPDV
jgi:copper ion binding protein